MASCSACEWTEPPCAKETARERGRHRRPSDAGLPSSILATPPVTEVDELTVGLTSDLADVVGGGAVHVVNSFDP